MSVFTRIKGAIMSIFQRYGIEQIEGLGDYTRIVSSEMQDKINLWLNIQQGKAYWNEDYPSSGIVKSIVRSISDVTSEEIKIESDNEKLLECMNSLHHKNPEIVSDMVTCGSCLVRPIYANNKVQFELIKLGFYLPTKYDFDGSLLGAIILKRIQDGKKQFLLVENHNYENKKHSVNLELLKVDGGNFTKVSLSACKLTENLTPSYSWDNVDKPFIVEIRNPFSNDIDFSNIPIAIYGGHENLIKDADRQYYDLNLEQISGRKHLFADEDMFRTYKDSDGKTKRVVLPEGLENVVVKLNGNGTSEEKIQEFSPVLRTSQQIEALQQIYREIENVCGIGKGTLSNLEEMPQTATQYKGGKAVLYNTINTFESEIEKKYKDIAYIFAYMISVYEKEIFDDVINITYDESDRKDSSLQRQEDLQEVAAGIMSKAEYRVKHYSETLEEAETKVPESEIGGFVL